MRIQPYLVKLLQSIGIKPSQGLQQRMGEQG